MFDPISLIIQVLIAVALNIAAYLLAPKPKREQPSATRNLDDPTAEAGREIPVVFGTLTVKSPNCLWFGEKSSNAYKVKA